MTSGKISEARRVELARYLKNLAVRRLSDRDGNLVDDPMLLEAAAALSVPAPGTGGAPQWFLDRQTPTKSDQQIEEELTGNAGLLCARELASEGLKSVATVKIGGSRPVSTPQGGDMGAGIRQVIFDALDLSEELRIECTADIVNALTAAGLLSSSPVGEMDGWQTMDSAPHACHVLATRFDSEFGGWVYAVVMSPPSPPFTHWSPLPGTPQGGR